MIRVLLPRRSAAGTVAALSAALLTVAVVLGGLLLLDVARPVFQDMDNSWHDFSATVHTPLWDAVNPALNWAGYRGMLAFHIVLAFALIVGQRPISAAFSATAGLAVVLVTQLAKWAIGRERPADNRVFSDNGSYPSGHVSATTAFLLVLALLLGRWWVWMLSLAGIFAMMLSRTYLAAHWFTDVVGGACLSAGMVLLLWLAFQDICIRENMNAVHTLIWWSRASRRRKATGQAESAPR
ncbi:phosphatase PAP2 family protein [Arthrobacter cavernae]|uniref:Phosphatase PAP2 family protein n=1 Tax=Arthrobacter cavernae TaxID=2817681 RepID=A0A939HH75_9MICC|nr:phosphatase PAP2 family protein [Arthrobacter cavernae]MBO1268218.1 phosphatase PAP2 family protein [Arthrobacter cavernae]